MNNILGMKESCFFCEQNVLCTKEVQQPIYSNFLSLVVPCPHPLKKKKKGITGENGMGSPFLRAF